MPRFLIFTFAGLMLWLLTGVYIVGGNERGVVRRFGKAVADSDGQLLLFPSGLHFDWPWPISRVDRVNLNEIKTLSVPAISPEIQEDVLLSEAGSDSAPAFLTGDKNLLNVRIAVHYRISSTNTKDFLYCATSVNERLSNLTESRLAGLLARSGVDFAQLTGRAELRKQLLDQLQQAAKQQRLGIVIEEVTFEDIAPPVQVKADFLDVANARADREQTLQTAFSLAEQRKQAAAADARGIRDAARAVAQENLQAAQGSADRFHKIMAELSAVNNSADPEKRALARRLALERYYHQTMTEIMKRIEGKVFLDTGQPVDITIWGSRNSNDQPMPTTPKGDATP